MEKLSDGGMVSDIAILKVVKFLQILVFEACQSRRIADKNSATSGFLLSQ